MRLLAIGFVCVAGAVLGWGTASATQGSRRHLDRPAVQKNVAVVLPHSSTLMVVPIRSESAGDERREEELARLEARNRRLEALVRVLQNREAERQP
jgi:hypothetical protein